MPSVTLDSLTTFGDYLRHLRRRARLTQREFGIAVGYSEAHVGRLESNERRPEVATVSTRFVEALDLEREPQLAARLVELAKTAHAAPRGEATARPRLTNLPAPLTHLIGRERELAAVTALVLEHRLVTLLGAGGIGKTRLANEAGHALFERGSFPDGVWWIELVPVSEPALVAQTVAATFKLSESDRRTHLDALVDHLESKHALLILDNCEHLIEACAALVESLLQHCPSMHVLATSRESLRVLGETAFQVPPLDVSNDPHSAPKSALDYEAVQMFVVRVCAADHTFELTAGNIDAVAQVCRQLDGIPLALELAAALTQTMTVGEIAAGLDEKRALPASGYRTADPRHQTMRRALDWSYALLPAHEQRLLARLTVFHGGWMAEAAEAVCSETDIRTLDLLHQLAHKSLVVTSHQNEVTRYRLLEPIRQYADEKLRQMGEWDAMRDRHAEWFATYAERAEIGLMGYEHGAWVKRLEEDHSNVLAALAWSRDHAQTGDAYVRMAASLWRYWAHRREYREGASWVEPTLARIGTVAPSLHIKVRSAAAWMIALRDDIDQAGPLAEENLKLSREAGDSLGIAHALAILAWWARSRDPAREVQLHEESVRAYRQTPDLWTAANEMRFLGVALAAHDPDRAAELIEEALDLWQKMGSAHGVAFALGNLGDIALRRGEYERAYTLFEQSLVPALETGFFEVIAYCLDGLGRSDRQRSIAFCEERLADLREAGDTKAIALTLHLMGHMILDAGDFTQAGAIFEECLLLWRQMHINSRGWSGIAMALRDLGHVARFQGDFHLALSRYKESLDAYQAARNLFGVALVHLCLGNISLAMGKLAPAAGHFRLALTWWQGLNDAIEIALLLIGWSELAQMKGQTQRSARLAGAASVFLPDHERQTLRPIDQWDFDRVIAVARAQLGDPVIAAAWAAGAAMTLEQAIALALRDGD